MNLTKYPVGQTFQIEDIPAEVVTLGYERSENPAIPKKNPGYVFRRDFLRVILNYLQSPDGDGLCISGPTGSGKTSGICEVLARLNWPCQQVTAHGRLELSDLIGQFKLVSKSPGQPPVMEFVYGVLPTAMKYGHVLLINELDYCDPSEVSGLNDVIEGRPLVITENGGEVITPHPMFRIIATCNSSGRGDSSGLYRGVNAQNIAFMDRFRVTTVGYLSQEDEIRLLGLKVPAMPEAVRAKLVEVANAVRAQFLGESGDGSDGTLSVTMSTRTLARWAKLTSDFKRHETPMAYALTLALTNRCDAAEKEAIEKIAEGIMGDLWSANTKKVAP